MYKKIYIPIEVPKRELFYKLNLASHLVDRGWKVFFGPEYPIEDLRKLKHRDNFIYFEKSLTKNTSFNINTLHKLGFSIVCLDEEGLVHKRSRSWWASHRIYRPMLEFIDQYYCYNTKQENDLKLLFTDHAHKFFTTGSPRFDSSVKKLMGSENNVKIYDLLFLSNFIFSRNKGGPDFVIRHLKKMGRLNSVDDKKFWSSMTDYSNQLEKYFIKLLEETCNRYPELKIAVRPHPAEDDGLWYDLVKKYDNLVVDTNLSVEETISASEIIVHNNCTTGVQGIFLDTFTVAYTPISDDKYDANIPNKISSRMVKSHCEFFDLIDSRDFKRIKNSNFSELVPSNGVANISKRIEKMTFKRQSVFSSFYYAAYLFRKNFLKIYKFFRLKDFGSKYHDSKGKEMTSKNISLTLQLLSRSDLFINKISTSVYELKKHG